MTANAIRILVVDDEPPIRRLLRVGLSTEGYVVIEAADAAEAIAHMAADRPDVVILDLGLPDIDGHALLTRWREEGILLPILILSSRSDEAGIVKALELGADDYVVKPFGVAELAARVRVALRHRLQVQGEQPVFKVGDLQVDLVKRIVRVAGEEISLSPREYDILRLMVQHAGKVLTHQLILRQVWGAAGDVQYLRVYVRQLRQKIEASPDQPRYIITETGVGYRLKVDE